MRTLSTRCAPGMTLEMAGTLLGAAAHGLIVAGAHGPHRCEDAESPGPGAVSPNAVSARALPPDPPPAPWHPQRLWRGRRAPGKGRRGDMEALCLRQSAVSWSIVPVKQMTSRPPRTVGVSFDSSLSLSPTHCQILPCSGTKPSASTATDRPTDRASPAPARPLLRARGVGSRGLGALPQSTVCSGASWRLQLCYPIDSAHTSQVNS